MNVFGIGLPEIAIILICTSLIFGPKKLSNMGRLIGKTIKGLQQASSEFKNEIAKDISKDEKNNAA